MTEPTVDVKFKWLECRPDAREFRQNSCLLQPEVIVVVHLPIKSEYIANWEKLITNSISNEVTTTLSPLLTPLGVKYCMDELEKVFVIPLKAEEFAPETEEEDDDGWE